MADLDGKNARIIIGDKKKTPHVFAITTFEGEKYTGKLRWHSTIRISRDSILSQDRGGLESLDGIQL